MGRGRSAFPLLIALVVEAYLGGRGLRFAWSGNPRRAVAALCLDLERRLSRAEQTAGEQDRAVMAISVIV